MCFKRDHKNFFNFFHIQKEIRPYNSKKGGQKGLGRVFNHPPEQP